MKILTMDPSITAWGWAALDIHDDISVHVKKIGCIKTRPQSKRARIRKGDDDIHRLSEIMRVLSDLIATYDIDYLCSELPHGSQVASGMKMVGQIQGILSCMKEFFTFPVEWYSEQDAKKTILRKRSASKDEMIEAIDKIFVHVPWTGTKYIDEAVADSLAIFYTAYQESQILKVLKSYITND